MSMLSEGAEAVTALTQLASKLVNQQCLSWITGYSVVATIREIGIE